MNNQKNYLIHKQLIIYLIFLFFSYTHTHTQIENLLITWLASWTYKKCRNPRFHVKGLGGIAFESG